MIKKGGGWMERVRPMTECDASEDASKKKKKKKIVYFAKPPLNLE